MKDASIIFRRFYRTIKTMFKTTLKSIMQISVLHKNINGAEVIIMIFAKNMIITHLLLHNHGGLTLWNYATSPYPSKLKGGAHIGINHETREMIKFLVDSGYTFIRAKGGSHHIYGNGSRSIPIPIHGGKDFGEEFIRMVLREAGISKTELLKYLKR